MSNDAPMVLRRDSTFGEKTISDALVGAVHRSHRELRDSTYPAASGVLASPLIYLLAPESKPTQK
jgi:hypothetical protein